MLNIKNFNNLKGDYIQCDGYTLSIEDINQGQEKYAITVSLTKQNGPIEDYIGFTLLRDGSAKYSGNYVLYQTHASHLRTEVTLNCIKNKDWFGYMICQMAGNNNWQMKIKPIKAYK